MADKIVCKKYCRITFTLASPLAVGSGSNLTSDKDIMRDAQGEPYIPASAIAGVCRSLVAEGGESEANLDQYFGNVKIHQSADQKSKSDQINSALIFYDARMERGKDERYYTSIRDSVALDTYKNSVKGAKFDMEILEPGVRFRTYLEQNFSEGRKEDYVRKIVAALSSGKAFFGAKSMRGYGAIQDIKAETIDFDLNKPDQNAVRKWILFDVFDDKAWKGSDQVIVEGAPVPRQIILTLNLRGGISIRKYTTEVKQDAGSRDVADFKQMTVRVSDGSSAGNFREIPVIPGTSWAGAVRHRMKEFGLEEKEEIRLFGYVRGKGAGDKARSVIRFSESQITGGMEKEFSRNAIDRFSGGTVDGALFTERTYYGGTTQLVISFDKKSAVDEWTRTHLAAALTDLHHGFLAVGGETSIGRGLFRIAAVNNKTIQEGDDVFAILDKALEDCLSGQEKEA